LSSLPTVKKRYTEYYFLKSLATCRSDDVKDEKCKPEVKQDDSSDATDEEKDAEEAEVRDVKHMLETLVWSIKVFCFRTTQGSLNKSKQ